MTPTVQRVRELVVSYRPCRCQLPVENTVTLGDRLTLALAAHRGKQQQRTLVHSLVLAVRTVRTVRAVRTERATRQRGELIGVARLDLGIATTNPAKGVHA